MQVGYKAHLGYVLSELAIMSTDIAPESLADRIRECAAIVGSGNELSRLSGIPRRSLENYLKGREPKAAQLAAIARAASVSLDWLITGEGARRLDPANEVAAIVNSPSLDRELLGRVTDAIDRLYREEGARLPAVDLGRLSADKYQEIIASGVLPEDYPAALAMAIANLRKQLRTANTDPANSKRRA